MDNQGLFIDERVYPLVMSRGLQGAMWINRASLVKIMQGVWAYKSVLALITI